MRQYSRASYLARHRRTPEAEALGNVQTAKCARGHYLRFWTDRIGRVHETCDECEAAARSARVAARAAAEKQRNEKRARERQRIADAAERGPRRPGAAPRQCAAPECDAQAVTYSGLGRPPRYCPDHTPQTTALTRRARERARGC